MNKPRQLGTFIFRLRATLVGGCEILKIFGLVWLVQTQTIEISGAFMRIRIISECEMTERSMFL